MAISINSRPERVKGGYTGLWVATNNPVVFGFENTPTLDDAVQVALFELDGVTQIVELDIIPFPSSNTITIDASAFLQSELDSNNDSVVNQVTTDTSLPNKFKGFRVGFRADGNGSYTVDSTEYIAVNNVKQAGDTYGVNLVDYLPDFNPIGGIVNQTGKFLSTFEKPVLFWYSDNLAENPASIPANQVTIFRPSFGWCLTDEIEGQAEYKVMTDSFVQGSNAGMVDETVPILNDKGLRVANYITSIPASDDSYTKNLLITSIATSTDDELIEGINIEVRRVCNNPTVIKWLDKLGSWQVWAFDGSAIYGHAVESGDTVGIPFNDISTLTRTAKTLRKTESPTLTVSAIHLKENEVIALSGIQSSPNVLLCTTKFVGNSGVSADDWQSINVLDSSRPLYDRTNSRYSISFEFELIESFTINN